MERYADLETLFAREQLRLTSPRRAVFDALRAAHEPLMIRDIIAACPSVDRVSIYRTLDLFVSLNVADLVPLGWKQRYELTSPFKPHHHHLYCTNCGTLIDVHSQKLEQLVAAIAREHEFTPSEHKFEISGLCANCVSSKQQNNPS
jgi:Fe2+ or Zn2+ uptake regulation protein